MKAGLMEIANIFVVNKADHSNADEFVKNLRLLAHTHQRDNWEIPVIKTVATQQEGLPALITAIAQHQDLIMHNSERHAQLLTEKTYQLIQHRRMKDIDRRTLHQQIRKELAKGTFNLYQFVNKLPSSF
jgi:LAO/AO transport system kinase